MRGVVKANFLDRYDSSIQYNIGDTVDWDDQERIADCVKRGLIEAEEEPKPKKTTKKTTK